MNICPECGCDNTHRDSDCLTQIDALEARQVVLLGLLRRAGEEIRDSMALYRNPKRIIREDVRTAERVWDAIMRELAKE